MQVVHAGVDRERDVSLAALVFEPAGEIADIGHRADVHAVDRVPRRDLAPADAAAGAGVAADALVIDAHPGALQRLFAVGGDLQGRAPGRVAVGEPRDPAGQRFGLAGVLAHADDALVLGVLQYLALALGGAG
ncbi:MAG: hypothetical protein IPK27_10040 [Rhodanobacteraceae bacterium]|nr:hypothetical protein [Rhodanobacteraceae bacterium]